MDRSELEQRWIKLTRTDLPQAAKIRDWPVHLDHCFQRICLDHACDGCWYDTISKRPAYRHASDSVLTRAVAFAVDILNDTRDLHAMNRQSLTWRGKLR